MSDVYQPIQAPEFSSAAALFEHYKQVKKRLSRPVVVLQQPEKKETQPVPVTAVSEPGFADVKLWMMACHARLERTVMLSEVLQATSQVTGFSAKEICSVRRFIPVTLARHLYFYCARHVTTKSLPEIGRSCGNRDHNTVINGIDNIARRRDEHREKIRAIYKLLGVRT